MSRTMRDILYYATPIMTVIAMFFIVYGSYIAGGIFIGIGTVCACLASMESGQNGSGELDGCAVPDGSGLPAGDDLHAHGAA